MPPAQASTSESTESPVPYRIYSRMRAAVRWRPALLAAVLVLAVTAWLVSRLTGTAALKLAGRHTFRSASVTILVDGKSSYSEQVSGTSRKRYGLFEKVAGTFAKTLVLPEGEHVIEVRFTTPDGYNQVKRCGVKLIPGTDATIHVVAQRSGLTVTYEGPPVAPATESETNYFAYLRSFLITVGGSAMSATIGFIVQDFLKTKRPAQPAAATEPSPSDAIPT